MSFETIAIMAPGNMGHGLGGHLVKQGVRVITNLEGRSAETAARAERMGMEDVGSDAALVREADILLSVLPPANAIEMAERIARAVGADAGDLLYVDCNAIAPATAVEVARILSEKGILCVDASIRSGPPIGGRPQPRIYASGEGAERFAGLNDCGLDIRVIGPLVGQASALKMCAAGISKGMVMIVVQAFLCARALGVERELADDVLPGGELDSYTRRAPNLGPDAYRWASEMDEIAATMASAKLSPLTFAGMAETCRFVEGTPVGRQSKENMTIGTDFQSLVAALGEALPPAGPDC